MPATHVLRLRAPALAEGAEPGQFIHVRTGDGWDPLLRRPMSIYLIHPDGVSIMVRNVGRGSDIIIERRSGELLDCLGPLGVPFQLRQSDRRLLLVGGGYGVAPLVGLAERALEEGKTSSLLVGAATAAHVFPSERVPNGVDYRPATMDGSQGYQGLVTDLIPEHLQSVDAVYACGPTGMLEAAARHTSGREGLYVEVSMEQQMGCAMGVCLGCVIPTRSGFQRVCREGPVFDPDKVLWERFA